MAQTFEQWHRENHEEWRTGNITCGSVRDCEEAWQAAQLAAADECELDLERIGPCCNHPARLHRKGTGPEGEPHFCDACEHEAQLKRVAEAVRYACREAMYDSAGWVDAGGRFGNLDLDAIIKQTK